MSEHASNFSAPLHANMDTAKTDTKELRSSHWIGWLLICFVFLVAIALILAYGRIFPSINNSLHVKLSFREAAAWGQLGDFMGGILNPLISACTLAVAVLVWNLQKSELKETQKALNEQAKTLERQRQEQRFFDLLNVYQRTVESISLTRAQSSGHDSRELLTSSGKQAISVWLIDTSLNKTALGPFDSTLEKGKVESHWKKKDAPGLFDHYFRVVFRILSEAKVLLGDQHHQYVELFRAQLSRSELMILGYNLWLDEDAQNMIHWAENYHLLKYLPSGHLRTELETSHPNIFPPSQAQSPEPSSKTESGSPPC